MQIRFVTLDIFDIHQLRFTDSNYITITQNFRFNIVGDKLLIDV